MNNKELQDQLLSEFNDRFDNDTVCDIDTTLITDETSEERVNIERIKGFRTGSNLIWSTDEQYLYYKNVQKRTLNEIACTCYEKECDARIFIKEDGSAYKLRSTKHKHHGSMYDIHMHMHCFNKMKDRCHTAPASMSVREIYNESVLEYVIAKNVNEIFSYLSIFY